MLKKNTPKAGPVRETIRQTQNATDLQKILLLLREFQKLDSEFPLQYAVCLLQIASREGISLTDLANRTGMALSSVSRIVGALSRFRQKGEAFDLVRVQICAEERRRKELYLSEKGRAVIEEILRISRIV